MYRRTREFIGRVERFDSLSETITDLTLAGDTAHAIVDQRTVRQQRFPDGGLHGCGPRWSSASPRIKTPEGLLLLARRPDSTRADTRRSAMRDGNGGAPTPPSSYSVTRWGPDGFAYIGPTQVAILRSDLTPR